jgi:hypothetical protein
MLKHTFFSLNRNGYIPNTLKKSPYIDIVRAKIISLLILSFYLSLSIESFFSKLKVYTVSEVRQ